MLLFGIFTFLSVICFFSLWLDLFFYTVCFYGFVVANVLLAPHVIDFISFLKSLSDSKCAFSVYDYEYKTADGRITSSLYSIYWMPENTNQNDRIIYSSAKGNFTNELSGYKVSSQTEHHYMTLYNLYIHLFRYNA